MFCKQSINKIFKFTVLIVSILLIFNSAFIYAKEKRKFPRGCRPIGFDFKDQYLLLKSEAEEHPQTLYLLHNTSRYDIQLSLVNNNNLIKTPRFENTIKSKLWGAFATDEPEMKFSCHIKSKHHDDRMVDCSNIFEICQYNRAKFADNNMGNYWVVNSNTLRKTVYKAITYGILLRW